MYMTNISFISPMPPCSQQTKHRPVYCNNGELMISSRMYYLHNVCRIHYILNWYTIVYTRTKLISRSNTIQRRSMPRKSTLYKDQGWAWVVLAGTCFGMMISGVIYVGGLFNIIFLDVFGLSRQKTAWVTAIQGSVLSMTG